MNSKMTKLCHQQSAISNVAGARSSSGIQSQQSAQKNTKAESRKLKAESWLGLVRPAYTLIEMLISVTIFSGLLIIVLGSFASSSSSSAKVNTLREKNQAARALIDQITNDLRYVDTTVGFKEGVINVTYEGYRLEQDLLVMALRLPNADPNVPLTRKEYRIKSIHNDSRVLTLLEGRKCKIVGASLSLECAETSAVTDLLSSGYTLNPNQNEFPTKFGGLTVLAARNNKVNNISQPISPYVSIDLTVKPAGLSARCDSNLVDPGTCYTVSTKVNMGSSR